MERFASLRDVRAVMGTREQSHDHRVKAECPRRVCRICIRRRYRARDPITHHTQSLTARQSDATAGRFDVCGEECVATQELGSFAPRREMSSSSGLVNTRVQSLPEQKKRSTAQASTCSVFGAFKVIFAK